MIALLNPVEIDAEVQALDPVASVQRILDYLDGGGELNKGALRVRDNYCILGLFAKEYPGGSWYKDEPEHSIYNFTDDKGDVDNALLTPSVVKYYGLQNGNGWFNINRLPSHIRQLDIFTTNRYGLTSLSSLNDHLISLSNPDTNKIMAAIIRSGALFEYESIYKDLD